MRRLFDHGRKRAFVSTLGLALLSLACGSVPELDVTSDDDDGSGGKKGGSGGGSTIVIDDPSGGSSTGGGGGTTSSVCGNGELEVGELCDDGGTDDSDGCSGDCLTQDPDYDCSTPGKPCKDMVVCGNGILEGDELCDEGTNATGACTSECSVVAAGYSCPRPGVACVALPVCGNGIRERGEQCDDGESPAESLDGCSDTCELESGYFCVPGSPCVPMVCGNGTRTPDEACDDNNLNTGDGCDAACEVELGYRCSTSGCRAICGDGLIVGSEECDDVNRTSGDGCSSACLEESNLWTCSGEPSVCVSKVVCGNGAVDPGEVCDDGPGGDCVDPPADNQCDGFIVVGVDPPNCGDNVLQYLEECEDSNTATGDGCDAMCKVESGWVCPKKNYCYQLPICGDGKLQAGETCDVGGFVTSTAACQDCEVQANYFCSGEPSVCQQSICGDGFRALDEQCDDGPGTLAVPGTPVGGDGCSATCTVESGWVCPPGAPCVTKCGDGVVTAPEECEFSGAGCTNCRIAAGYDCGVDGKTCVATRCGNGIKEHGEGCDNDVVTVGAAPIAGDGCGPTCQVEPTITPATSSSTYPTVAVTCGDGIKTASEGCDDGNTASGDGCSSSCSVENGWSCSGSVTYPDAIKFKVTYRDFTYRTDSANGGHPHMRNGGGLPNTGSDSGIVGPVCTTANASTCGRLDSAGKPQYDSTATNNTITSGDGLNGYHAAAFGLWYRDTNPCKVPTYNRVTDFDQTTFNNCMTASGAALTTTEPIQIKANPAPIPAGGDVLTLTKISATAYQYSSTVGADDNNFYPLGSNSNPTFTDRGFGSYASGSTRNWNFTSELRYYFQYQGGETLTFYGDDDVWVFVNGRLAVDIGGIHGTEYGRVVLGDTSSDCSVNGGGSLPALGSCYSSAEQSATTDTRFGLTKNNVYEIVVFQAERNPTGSNYQLTLDGFLAPRSFCQTDCGDGIRAGSELCDAGGSNKAAGTAWGSGQCDTACTYRFCGDGVDDPEEACDNGNNTDVWTSNGTGCAPGCVLPSKCGDGVVQSAFEVCDDGTNTGTYGGCEPGCGDLAGYCGDNTTDAPAETCDTGSDRVPYGEAGDCGLDCKAAPFCGDSTRNGQEQCDLGALNGVLGSGCTADCEQTGYCGDGSPTAGEECDNGTYNSGATAAEAPYGGCSDGCLSGPECGDDVVQSDFEECDEGTDNVDSGYGKCTTACVFGERCGDGAVQASFEACDNGYNEDTYAYVADACGPNCTAVPYCGDGTLQSSFELCDLGVNNSNTTYNGCRLDCTWGPYCGDNNVDAPTETCDAGTANVSYSADGTGCGYDCKLAPSCGDGVRNGPEQCDLGKASNTGEYGGCNANCTYASRCGDKVVDSAEGEQCDDGPTGSLSCSSSCQGRVITN